MLSDVSITNQIDLYECKIPFNVGINLNALYFKDMFNNLTTRWSGLYANELPRRIQSRKHES